eukprot:357535-Rhodomonas_salina.1
MYCCLAFSLLLFPQFPGAMSQHIRTWVIPVMFYPRYEELEILTIPLLVFIRVKQVNKTPQTWTRLSCGRDACHNAVCELAPAHRLQHTQRDGQEGVISAVY